MAKASWNTFIPWLEIEGIKDIILDKYSVLDILDLYKIDYTKTMTNKFSHKAICPFHNDGEERTPSFYISTETNSYYCFACQITGNPITFISTYEGCPNEVAINKLAKLMGITKDTKIEDIRIVKKEKNDWVFKIEEAVFNSGVLIRDFIKNIEGEAKRQRVIKWADNQFKSLDEFLNKEDEGTAIKAQTKFSEIKEYLEKRKQ